MKKAYLKFRWAFWFLSLSFFRKKAYGAIPSSTSNNNLPLLF